MLTTEMASILLCYQNLNFKKCVIFPLSKKYCHIIFLEYNLLIIFGKKVGKNDNLRWEIIWPL